SSAGGIPLVPTQASILSHSRAPSTPRAGHTGKESENAAGEKADTFGGKQCDPLHHGTPVPRSVSGWCWVERCSPWSAPFSPQTPPRIALLCSSGSSIVWCGPTPLERARPPSGFAPSRTGLVPVRAEALQRSPGSRACCFSACAGSPTTQDRLLARDLSRNSRDAFLHSGESRRPGFAVLRSSIARPTDTPVYASSGISRRHLQD